MVNIKEIENGIETSVNMIKNRVGDTGKVIVLVSGGVDSMVTAALLLKALPVENVYAIHVDHGFMRKNESDFVCVQLEKLGFKNFLRVNAQDKFLYTKAELDEGEFAGPLIEVADPELKRKIIGSLFIEVVKEAADTFNLDYDKTFIAQGTLKPDLIESGNPDIGDETNRVKTHHNDVDIVRKARAKGLIIETNWNWYKDEVRQVARMLGIDEEIASRQPFPGPGLAVRQLCSNKNIVINEENIKLFDGFINNLNIKRTEFVYGLVAPILSVGVRDEKRSYKNLAVLYGEGTDADFERLSKIAAEIPKELNFINRYAYVLNKKNISGLKQSELTMAAENTELLRETDYIITKEISKWLKENPGEANKISQYFGVLTPICGTAACPCCSNGKKYSVVIRVFVTVDFMTGKAAIPGKDIPLKVLRRIVDRIEAECHDIDLVLYDMTDKPPATVEWE